MLESNPQPLIPLHILPKIPSEKPRLGMEPMKLMQSKRTLRLGKNSSSLTICQVKEPTDSSNRIQLTFLNASKAYYLHFLDYADSEVNCLVDFLFQMVKSGLSHSLCPTLPSGLLQIIEVMTKVWMLFVYAVT